jgi:hypothetical protein
MALPRRYELDELAVRPGTYFNPETEVLIVVDDTPDVDQAIFDADAESDSGEWVFLSDEAPIDEAARDELLERFQARHHGSRGPVLDEEDEATEVDDEDDDELEDDEEEDDGVEELDGEL